MKWIPNSADTAQIELLAAQLSSSSELRLNDSRLASTLARLLVLRGIADPHAAEQFLSPSLSHLHSPYTMSGMKAAVDRLDAAIERKEGILIYGDYDVDGTTAIVILKTAIELCGGSSDFYVPHRIREGYGMKDDVIERAAEAGIRLIISVDTGIRAFAAAETARRLDVDLIVTDHHLPGHDGVPAALAVLNPNQPGCEYPCKVLCGAGVAFKLAQALMERRLTQSDQSRLVASFMKIVAIATIADAVPLTGENRVFAKLGLEDLRPTIAVDAELALDQVTPELFQALRRLEPFGVGNPEPVFIARDVFVKAPPRIMKERHVKLRLSAGESSNLARLVTPRCHPDSSTFHRHDETGKSNNWRRSISFDALGWNLAERIQQAQLLPGDTLDIAFSLDQNEHPELGGLELSLRDFIAPARTDATATEPEKSTATGI